LFLAATNIRISDIGLFLNLHHRDRWIDLGRKWDVNLILVTINANSHALLNISWSNGISQVNYELCKLFDIDDVLGII
jgi:hypothetical protein